MLAGAQIKVMADAVTTRPSNDYRSQPAVRRPRLNDYGQARCRQPRLPMVSATHASYRARRTWLGVDYLTVDVADLARTAALTDTSRALPEQRNASNMTADIPIVRPHEKHHVPVDSGVRA